MDTSRLYLLSLYWTLATMITVGYGDIRPGNNAEVGFAIGVIFSGHALFAYLFGLITNYVTTLDRTAALFRDKLVQINQFMDYRQLSPHLRARISDFYSGRLWFSTGGVDELAILNALPCSIRQNVSLFLYAPLLTNVPIFKGAEYGFIQSLADRLEPHIFPPSELVVVRGEIGREMFFCARGACEVLGMDDAKRIFLITAGMYFGEVAVLFSVKRTASVRTVTYCDVLSLNKSSLGEAMRDYPKEGKKIATLAKNRMDEFAEKTSGRKKIGAASKWRNVQAAAAGGGSDRSKSTSGTTVDAKPVASSMSAEAQLAGGYEAAARPGLARSRTQPLVAHERVTPVRAPGAR